MALLFGFVIPLFICLFAIFTIISDIFGAPYVPTSSKILDEILKEARLEKGQLFIELGSGDGRVLRRAVKNFQVKGVGVDMNPLLIIYSKTLTSFMNLNNIHFKVGDIYKEDLKKADAIFLFLLPRTVNKLREKILGECRKNTLVISHGFKIEGWEKYLVKTQKRKLFSTYFYKITYQRQLVLTSLNPKYLPKKKLKSCEIDW